MAWYRRKIGFLENALLNKSRVLNSKCPKHLADKGVKRGK
jgi:hypothetical protein